MTENAKQSKEELEQDKIKLAKPDSMAFRSHYFQQRRKKRKERN